MQLVLLNLGCVSLGLLSHHRDFMSKSSVAHMFLFPNVLLPAHHQMLSYCSLAKLDSHVSGCVRQWLCNVVDKNLMAEISA